MQVASIVGVNYLELTEKDSYHMCLAHMVRELNDPYTRFFAERTNQGQFLIMDNGVAEESQLSDKELLEKANIVLPSEIVLRDTVHHGEETIRNSSECLDFFTKARYSGRYMAVPQGHTWKEWEECAWEMLKWPIHTIGISKFLNQRYGPYARFIAVELLIRMFMSKSLKNPTWKFPDIHLLGCWADPREVGTLAMLSHDSIRGVDSAIPYVYAQEGLLLDANTPRPNKHPAFYTDRVDAELLKQNIDLWKVYSNE